MWANLDSLSRRHPKFRKNVLIVGSGPCGLRLGIQLALGGHKSLVIEKRADCGGRINRLHLWPWVRRDIEVVMSGRNLLPGEKQKAVFADADFCHLGIDELQCLLLKNALLLGVEVQLATEYVSGVIVERDSEERERRRARERADEESGPLRREQVPDVVVCTNRKVGGGPVTVRGNVVLSQERTPLLAENDVARGKQENRDDQHHALVQSGGAVEDLPLPLKFTSDPRKLRRSSLVEKEQTPSASASESLQRQQEEPVTGARGERGGSDVGADGDTLLLPVPQRAASRRCDVNDEGGAAHDPSPGTRGEDEDELRHTTSTSRVAELTQIFTRKREPTPPPAPLQRDPTPPKNDQSWRNIDRRRSTARRASFDLLPPKAASYKAAFSPPSDNLVNINGRASISSSGAGAAAPPPSIPAAPSASSAPIIPPTTAPSSAGVILSSSSPAPAPAKKDLSNFYKSKAVWQITMRDLHYERGNYSPADHSYVRLYKREAPTQCRFVASRRPSRRLLVVCRGDVSWEGGCGRLRRGSRWTCPQEREWGDVVAAFRLTMRSHPRAQSLSVVTPSGCCCISVSSSL